MIFKKLILTSFGKFNNKVISLEEGVNVIFGHNEAGKTTIHKFIEGMLYGFFKPYSKRKLYTEDYDKFLPWEQNDFYGALKYKSKNNTYRIERNFMKGYDEVKVFDDETGEDLSHMFEYDSSLRVCSPTSLHLRLNSVVFNNTISIRQLGSRTEDSLSKEVKDSLINLGGSLDQDISVKKVLEKLDSKIDFIGTKGRIKTSPYGKVIKELEKLNQEEEKAQELYSYIKDLQVQVNEISETLESLKEHKNDINEKINLIEGYNINKRYREALKILEEIKNITCKIKELQSYKSINSDDYTKAIEENSNLSSLKGLLDDINHKYNNLKVDYQKLNDKLSLLADFESINLDEVEQVTNIFMRMEEKQKEIAHYNNKTKELEEKINSIDDKQVYRINDDIYEHEKLEQEKNNILYDKEYTNRSYLKSRLEEKEHQIKKFNGIKMVSVFLMIPALLSGYLLNPILYALTSIPLLLFIYTVLSSKELRKYINRLKRQIVEQDTNEIQRKSKVDSIDNAIKDILNRHSCNTKGELLLKANEYSAENALIKDKKDKLTEYKENIIKLQEETDKYTDILSRLLSYIEKDCEINNVNVKRFKEKYNDYSKLKDERLTLEKYIKGLQSDENKLLTRYNEADNKLKEILDRNKVTDLDDFKISLEKSEEYEKFLIEKENQEKVYKKVLNNETIETLEKKAMDYGDINIDNVSINEIKELNDELEKTNDNIRTNLEKLSTLKERINNLSSNTRPLVEIREDIIEKYEIKTSYENKLESLNLAKDVINKISKEIQRDFSPKLNKKVGIIINTITNGKYSDVKITENLDIKVIDPFSGRVVEIDRLSSGTIDQLYFAARLGIIDIIKGDSNFPIILDDCFTQYDFKRLDSILSYLSKEGLRRQILLFTCHEREKIILDKVNIKYNYIEI